jgi:hypothetical protein
MGFEESTGSKIRSIGNFIDVTQDIIRLQKERLASLKSKPKERNRSQTPERKNNAGNLGAATSTTEVNNPE